MPQQLLRGWPLIGIFDQASCDEILEMLAEGTLQSRGGIFGNVKENLHGVDVCEGRLAIRHFNGRDGQRPYVRLEVVPSLLDYLGCHPEGRPDKSVALGFDISQLRSDTKVCKLYLSRLGQEDICSLDIAMDFAFGMKIFETEEEFPADDGNVSLRKIARFEL